MKLQNGDNGMWMYGNKIWIIPTENSIGFIKDVSTGKVLSHLGDASDSSVILEEETDPLSEGQKWIRSSFDENGFFTFKNPSSDKVLTSSSATSISLEGVVFNTSYMSHPIEGLMYCWRFFKVSAQIAVALGSHFATLDQELDFYEGKKKHYYFSKKKRQIL